MVVAYNLQVNQLYIGEYNTYLITGNSNNGHEYAANLKTGCI